MARALAFRGLNRRVARSAFCFRENCGRWGRVGEGGRSGGRAVSAVSAPTVSLGCGGLQDGSPVWKGGGPLQTSGGLKEQAREQNHSYVLNL